MTKSIALVTFIETFDVLGALVEDYQPLSQEWRALVEARRLIEVETREQHGDAGWRSLTDRS